jgi:thiol-disulfide isomerase/thioredoxin
MKHLIIGTVIVMTSVMACTNNKQEETTSATEQQTDSNTAVSTSLHPTLPTFTVENINGNRVNLQRFKGKKVFVNLWASWCPPCKREMPSIEKLYHSVDTNKVAFVMISLDDQFEKSKSFIRSAKLKLPIYYPAENLPALFNVEGIPSTFIFSENGGLIKRMDGGDFYDTDEYRTLLK